MGGMCERVMANCMRVVNITYRDVMQGLEIEKCEASCPGATIFSQVLANLIDEPRIVEDSPIRNLLLPKTKLSGVPLHSRNLNSMKDMC